MTEKERIEIAEKEFIAQMKQLGIPVKDAREGMTFAIDYMNKNALSDDNRSSYWVCMAVAAYHAGKTKSSTLLQQDRAAV